VGGIIMGGFMNIKLLLLLLVSLAGTCCATEYFCVCGPDNAREIASDLKNKENCEEQDAAKKCIWEKKPAAIGSMLVASRSSYM
jgi:hypothetical protein